MALTSSAARLWRISAPGRQARPLKDGRRTTSSLDWLNRTGGGAAGILPCLSWDVTCCTMSALDPELGGWRRRRDATPGSTPARGVDAELLYFDSAAEIKWSDRRLRGKALIVYDEIGVGMRATAKKAGVACLVSVSNRPWPIVCSTAHRRRQRAASLNQISGCDPHPEGGVQEREDRLPCEDQAGAVAKRRCTGASRPSERGAVVPGRPL